MAQMWTRRAELPSSIPRPGLGTANTRSAFVNYAICQITACEGIRPEQLSCARGAAQTGFDVDT
jgi:hypothetical protein